MTVAACWHLIVPAVTVPTQGLDDRSVSSGVQRMIGLVSALKSFAESQYLLRELVRVSVGTSHMERTVETLGYRIARD
ncbi:MAG: hypothetical protein F4X92_05175 [Gammaproteobacteria bacterium]|nr:hypothetical protein [Gammaproteobacteria bacterium]